MEPATSNENYNADELVAPKWLNTDFIQDVLIKYLKDSHLKVLNVEILPASAKGDHYASIMFRAKVSYESQGDKLSKSLIIKTMPEQEGHKKDLLNGSHIFETEIGMYTKALPKFEKILRDAGDYTKLCAKCVYHSLEPRQVIIFEDLVPQGYMVLRDRGLNIEELKAAYTKLAKMQAVSFMILHTNPEYLQEFKNGINSMDNFMKDPMLKTEMSNFIEFLETQPELSKYVAFFKSIESTYLDSFVEVMEEYRANRQPNGYYVLCHGDFHLRNMMLKYDKVDGTLEDCMLLDFQMSNVCPISVDLIYSLYLLMGSNDRQYHHKELFEYYFSIFAETLQKIGFKGKFPNLEDFWKELARHKHFETFYLLGLPMSYAFKQNNIDLAEIVQNNEARKKLFHIKEFVEEVKYLLPKYEKLGYFKVNNNN